MGGAGGQHGVCKYNQTGFFKHGEKCFKYHKNGYAQLKNARTNCVN